MEPHGKLSLEEEGSPLLPKCLVWKRDEMDRGLVCQASLNSHLGRPAAAQGYAWKNALLAMGRSIRLLSWPKSGTSQHPRQWAVESAPQKHCGPLFMVCGCPGMSQGARVDPSREWWDEKS